MSILALDPSKSCTGFALLREGGEKPLVGHWVLGSEYTSDGQVFNKLLRCLKDLRTVEPFEHIYFEEALNPGQLKGYTTISTIMLAAGLQSTIQLFAYAKKLRTCHAVNVSQWRAPFIGKIENSAAKQKAKRLRDAGDKRASARDELKRLTKERCAQLGFTPANFDESDAIGILTHAISLRGGTAPWIASETLRPPLGLVR